MDCHRPLAFAMIVWVGCGDYHNEIATAFSKPRNDKGGEYRNNEYRDGSRNDE